MPHPTADRRKKSVPRHKSSPRIASPMRLSLWSLLLGTTLAATPAEWKSQSIYFLLTDRFARTDGSTEEPCDTEARKYCGGTWQGIIKKVQDGWPSSYDKRNIAKRGNSWTTSRTWASQPSGSPPLRLKSKTRRPTVTPTTATGSRTCPFASHIARPPFKLISS